MIVETVTVPGDGPRQRAAQLADAVALRAALAAGKLRLFKSQESGISPEASVAGMAAIEADYSGYAAGGVAIATAGEPYIGPDGGVYVTLPSVQFNCVPGTPNVPNDIGGAFYVDAADVLRGVAAFDASRRMETASDSIVVVMTLKVL